MQPASQSLACQFWAPTRAGALTIFFDPVPHPYLCSFTGCCIGGGGHVIKPFTALGGSGKRGVWYGHIPKTGIGCFYGVAAKKQMSGRQLTAAGKLTH